MRVTVMLAELLALAFLIQVWAFLWAALPA